MHQLLAKVMRYEGRQTEVTVQVEPALRVTAHSRYRTSKLPPGEKNVTVSVRSYSPAVKDLIHLLKVVFFLFNLTKVEFRQHIFPLITF